MIPWSSATQAGAAPSVDGNAVQWRRWRFHVALRPREGLVLYVVGFDDGTRVRSVLYRASLSEMVVPYGDPGMGWYFRNSFDVGELGMGAGVAALVPGVDCPANATLIDATIADASGAPRRRARAIALFERDGGLAWKHGDVSRRARELVAFSVSRLGNYDYGFEWIFHEDGTLEHRVLLTGIMTPKGVAPGHADSLASLVAPGVAAVHHQHFFNYRLDLDVDGAAPNQVEEVETHALATGGANAHGGGFAMDARPLATEQQARRQLDAHSGRRWRVINSAVRGALGNPTGYELVPGANADPFAAESSSLRQRAGFLDWHLWATSYADSERFAAGDYPNQSSGGNGLVRWSSANRSLVGGDIVLWYTLGITHNPRPEDWPVMPVHEAGFRLIPVGFFDRNPVLTPSVIVRPADSCVSILALRRVDDVDGAAPHSPVHHAFSPRQTIDLQSLAIPHDFGLELAVQRLVSTPPDRDALIIFGKRRHYMRRIAQALALLCVAAVPAYAGVPVVVTPEPASLVLLATGIGAIGVGAWWRNRRR